MGRNKNKNVRFNNIDFIDSALSNEATYYNYLNRMKMIVLSMFEWVNLPDGMDQRYLERTLYYDGRASLLYDKELGFINTRCSSNGYLNIYGLPTSLHCYSYSYATYRNLFTKILYNEDGEIINDKNKECIYVLNDWEGIPTASTIELFAYRLYNAEKSCDVNISAQKTPVLILCSDNERLTMENIYSQYEGNRPVIMGNKNSGVSLDTIKAIKTDAPYVADKLTNYKKEIWNEFLTFIGVNNIAVEKHERLITDEANQNNEVINLYLQNHLAPRQEACKKFNELFGLTGDKAVSVRVRSDLHNVIKNAESIINDYTNKELDDIIKEDIEGDING